MFASSWLLYPSPLMNEDLHKEDYGPHDGEDQLIQVCLQLTAIPLPRLWMKTCIRKTMDPMTSRNSWERLAFSWLLYHSPFMNEDLRKEDEGSHDGEERLIQVCLQLTDISLPPLWMKTCMRKTMDPMTARNGWSRFASSWLQYPFPPYEWRPA